MAVYRQIHVSFWQDEFVLDLDPEDKYFYLYLMTNSKTTQCGIYQLPKKVMVLELGYPIDTVSILLQRFIDIGKILYSEGTKEVFILNWLKHNSMKSPKVISCVEKELQTVKNKDFIKVFASQCIQYGYPIPTVCKDYGEEKEKEQEKEQEKEKEKEQPAAVNPFDFYQQNFGVLNSFISQDIEAWIDDTNEELVIEAMKISLQSQKPWKYAVGILKDWHNHNIKTLDQVAAHNKSFKPGSKKEKSLFEQGEESRKRQAEAEANFKPRQLTPKEQAEEDELLPF